MTRLLIPTTPITPETLTEIESFFEPTDPNGETVLNLCAALRVAWMERDHWHRIAEPE